MALKHVASAVAAPTPWICLQRSDRALLPVRARSASVSAVNGHYQGPRAHWDMCLHVCMSVNTQILKRRGGHGGSD